MADNEARKIPALLRPAAAAATAPVRQTAALLQQPPAPKNQADLRQDLVEKTLAVYDAVRAYGYKEKNLPRKLAKLTTPQLLNFGRSVIFGLQHWAEANERLPKTFFATPAYQDFAAAHTALATHEDQKWQRYATFKRPARPDSFFIPAGAFAPASVN